MHLLNLPLGPSTGFQSGWELRLDHCNNMLLVALEQEVEQVIYYSGNWWCPSFLVQDTEPQSALCLYKWLNEACCMKCYIRTRSFTNSLFPWDHCMMVFQPSLSRWTISFTLDSWGLWYTDEFVSNAMSARWAGPVAAKDPQTITPGTGTRCFRLNVVLCIMAKHLHFRFICPKDIFTEVHYFLSFLKCHFVNRCHVFVGEKRLYSGNPSKQITVFF